MIVVGYNGFTRSAETFGRLFNRSGRDRYRVLGHDAGVAVMIDGVLVAAVEEERVSRVKKTSDFPVGALQWCLQEAGITLRDVDRFAVPWRFTAAVHDAEQARLDDAGLPPDVHRDRTARLEELHVGLLSADAVHADLVQRTGVEVDRDRLVLVPHHMAHLFCGYRATGWDDAAFLVSDGRAEQLSSIMGELRGGAVRAFEDASVDIASSLALLYSKVTRYLGFTPNNDEYKVMGLSAFGASPRVNRLLDSVVELLPGGTYRLAIENPLLDVQDYYAAFDEIFERTTTADDFAFRARVARTLQDTVEAVTLHQLDALALRTPLRRLVFEGGLAQNCVNNSRALERSPFTEIAVSFAASDPGVSIGAAAYTAYALGDTVRHDPSPYLGPEYDESAIRAAIAEHADVLHVSELAPEQVAPFVAQQLLEPVVIGWFHGRTEFGPRALGQRSIIANPAYPGVQDLINTRVKHREEFRPFAPMLLAEDAEKVLDMGGRTESPYMTFVFEVRPEWRDRLPGVCHVDGTARAQTVTDASSPRTAALLREFRSVSGIPCLVNTSFNVAGEPIVSSPSDAIRCFLGTEIDMLVLDTFVLTKAVADPGVTGSPAQEAHP